MLGKLWRPGARALTVSAILALIVAILHTSALLNENPVEPWAEIVEDMKESSVAVGPFEITFYGVYQAVWIQVGALIALFGIKDLIVLAFINDADPRHIVRALALFNVAAYLGLVGLFFYFPIPPPLVSYVLLVIASGIAVWRSGAGENRELIN